MLDIRPLNDRFAVAPQIDPDDLPAIAAAGYVAVINNRPDDEQPGQPSGEAIRAAAAVAGLGYSAVPVGQRVWVHGRERLAFCRSGTRSCHLWALAAAMSGREPALLIAQAEGAGYDLAGLAPTLERLAR